MQRTAVLLIGILAAAIAPCVARAQDSGFNLSLHANDRSSAAAIGLPDYPGATVKPKTNGGDSDSADLGFQWGDSNFQLKVAKFHAHDDAARVYAFYRKALGRYGDVLECNHGHAVGSLQQTSSGLQCEDKHGGSFSLNGDKTSDDHELRAGEPHRFRIVSAKPEGNGTDFTLLYVEVPKDSKK
jgi:hypothetical protein